MAANKSVSPHRLAERKRRRRELIAVGVAGATLIAFVLAQTELPPLTRHTSLASNLAVISLFNLSFLLLGLMLFLVGRNLAKVIFERRRGLIGSKFQVRLVAGFIAVALIPSAFLLYVSGVFLHADINSWFNPEYQQILNDSLEIAKTYYLNSANNASHFARVLAGEISAQGLLAPQKRDELEVVHRQAPAGIQPRHHRGVLRRSQTAADRHQPEDPHRHRRVARFPDYLANAEGTGAHSHRPARQRRRNPRLGADLRLERNRQRARRGAGRLLSAAEPGDARDQHFARIRRLLPAANSSPAHHEQLPADAGR